MDVKSKQVQPSRTVLPKGVCLTAAPPKSLVKPIPDDGKEYVVVSPSSSAPTQVRNIVRPTSVRPQTVCAPSLQASDTDANGTVYDRKALGAITGIESSATTTDTTTDTKRGPKATAPAAIYPTIGSSPTEEDIIRQALVTSLSKEPGYSGLIMSRKSHYVIITNTAFVSGTEGGYVLNNVAVGTTFATRIGPQIRVKHLRLKFYMYLYHDDATFIDTDVYPPMFRFVLKKTTVPIAPGTIEATFFTDATPPGTQKGLFSGLGQNPTTTHDVLANVVHNPSSLGVYKLYREHTWPMFKMGEPSTEASTGNTNQILATGDTYSVTPKVYTFEWNVPLDFVASYDITAGSSPLTGQLEFSCLSITSALTTNAFGFTSQLDFEDVVSI